MAARWLAAAAAGLLLHCRQVAAHFDEFEDVVLGDDAPTANKLKDVVPMALFTHADNQLHCMERHLEHPCVPELRAYLGNKSDVEVKSAALDCVRGVLGTSQEYWELKNMTHLLLDLDTKEHVFDRSSRDNEFIMTGLQFAQKLIQHEQCLDDFDEKAELECRCVPLYGKISILKLKNAGLLQEAKALYHKLSSMSWQGKERSYSSGEAVPWDNFWHTPQVFVPGLRSIPVWGRELWQDLPICKQLEDNVATILEETERALKNESESGFEEAYRFLYDHGEWNRVLLYHGRQFTEECERVFPKTCALLKQWLPSSRLPWTSDQNEQVMVIKMKKGTDVELHSGPANNILNIHLGLTGDLQRAKLIVANETYSWEKGKVLAWDGSYDHRVHCLDCIEDRVIMMVRYMHPDMSPSHYKGMKRTHFEDIPLELQ